MLSAQKNRINLRRSIQMREESFTSTHKPLTGAEVKRLVGEAMEALKEERPEDYALLYELYFKHTSLHTLSRTLRIPRSTLRYRKRLALAHIKQIIETLQK